MRYATTEKVVTAWLDTLPGITAAMVGDQLPQADINGNFSWAASGFITPYGLGGAPNIYLPVENPVVGLKCWAVDPDTGRPPWNLANNLAQTVKNGCFTNGGGQFLTLPYCDQNARLMSAYMPTQPRRAYGDTGDYACTVAEVQLHWHAQ